MRHATGGRIQDGPTIPAHYQDQAEAVRAHLVHLRGGAPFLSPADALCLLRWLDARVSVRAILAALDRAVVSRRRTRARTRLTLTAAGRHLGKPPLIASPLGEAGGLQQVCARLGELADPHAVALADALAALPEGPADEQVPAAVAVCREHLERRWVQLPHADREARIEAAARDLGDLANVVDAETLRALAEEIARDDFRRSPASDDHAASWPRLDTATFDAVFGGLP